MSAITDNGRKMEYMTGKLIYSIEDGEFIIEKVEVPIADRGHGIARKLMEHAINKASSLNLTTTGFVYAQDEQTDINKLREFYKSFGFTIDGDDMMTL